MKLRAERPYARSHPGSAISDEQFDDDAVAAHAEWEATGYAEAAEIRYELIKQGPRKEDIAQGKAAMEQAEAQYRLVKEGLASAPKTSTRLGEGEQANAGALKVRGGQA